jgi:hypothetical protein
MDKTYDIYGLRVACPFELPGVPHWSGDAATSEIMPDVVIEVGEVPLELDPPFSLVRELQISTARALFRVPSVASFLVIAGREIVVSMMPGADVSLVMRHLLRTAMVVVCFHRRTFPLKAAAVMRNKDGIILFGGARSGKSTLTRALCKRGYTVIADDIVLLSADDRTVSNPNIWIHRVDARCRRLSIETLYRLRWLLPQSAEPETEPMPAFQAVLDLRSLVWWPGLIPAMNCEGAFLSLAAMLSSRGIKEFRRPMCLSTLGMQIDLLEQSFCDS